MTKTLQFTDKEIFDALKKAYTDEIRNDQYLKFGSIDSIPDISKNFELTGLIMNSGFSLLVEVCDDEGPVEIGIQWVAEVVVKRKVRLSRCSKSG